MFTVDLECENSHRFEGWYDNRAEYEQIVSDNELTCPLCDSTKVRNVMTTGAPVTAKRADKQEREQAWYNHVKKHAHYVGDEFADQAVAMMKGEMPERPIWGEAHSEEAKQKLLDHDVPFLPVPVPESEKN